MRFRSIKHLKLLVSILFNQIGFCLIFMSFKQKLGPIKYVIKKYIKGYNYTAVSYKVPKILLLLKD